MYRYIKNLNKNQLRTWSKHHFMESLFMNCDSIEWWEIQFFLFWAILVPKPIKTKIYIEIILAHKSFSPNPQDAQVIHGGHNCLHISVENYIRADIKPRKLQIANQIKPSLSSDYTLNWQVASRNSLWVFSSSLLFPLGFSVCVHF